MYQRSEGGSMFTENFHALAYGTFQWKKFHNMIEFGKSVRHNINDAIKAIRRREKWKKWMLCRRAECRVMREYQKEENFRGILNYKRLIRIFLYKCWSRRSPLRTPKNLAKIDLNPKPWKNEILLWFFLRKVRPQSHISIEIQVRNFKNC